MPSIDEIKDKWLFVVPIYNLELDKEIESELTIDRVTFISSKKFKLVRKRFGVLTVLSAMKVPQKDFFDKYKTFALIRISGKIEDIELKSLKLIEKELHILLSTFVGYSRRSYKNKIGIAGGSGYAIKEYVYISTTHTSRAKHNSAASNYRPVILNKGWKKYHKDFFFFKFLAMIKNKRSIQKGYKKELCRAVELMGKSFNSNDIVDAFLWNMIAIELLISKQGDSYRESLVKRLSAMFAWMDKWEHENYEEKIDAVYKKRSAYVHDGNIDAIEVKDLLFTDEILLNIIINIVKHPKVFTSKDSLIEFTKKVEAEHLLNLTSKVHPKSFCYVARRYTENDLNMLQ